MGRFNLAGPCVHSAKPGYRVGTHVVAVFIGVLGVTGVAAVQAGIIEGVNHTHWAINHFSVDKRSGIDIIGPYQGGGGGCCYIAPKRWREGLTVQVDWETGVGSSEGYPGTADWPRFLLWEEGIKSQRRRHTRTVSIPDYTHQKVCGITVHFLPCDDIQVTTSCYAYGHQDYPIKTPLQLPEPQSCPS